MRMYVALDVEWPGNRKRIRAGLEASAVHAICLCLAKRSNRDGWVAREELKLYQASEELIDRLVGLELLDADGDEWVRPHDWLVDNLSSDRMREHRTHKARMASHARWHDGPFDDCERCKQNPRSMQPHALADAGHADAMRPMPDLDLNLNLNLDLDTEQQQKHAHASDADGRRAVLEAAAAIIGEKAGARPGAQNPTAVTAAVARGVITDRYQDAYTLIAANPAITPAELAEALEPTAAPRRPEPINPTSFLKPVHEVLSDEPRCDPVEAKAAIEAMRSKHPVLTKPVSE